MSELELNDRIRDELVELSTSMREDSIEDHQVARLDQLLCECDGAAQYYAELSLLSSDLKDLYAYKQPVVIKKQAFNKKLTVLSFAASVFISVLLYFIIQKPVPFRGESVAHVSSAISTKFLYGGKEGNLIKTGSMLHKGPYLLKEGLLEIKYDSGATLIIEAPAEFNLKSKQLVSFKSGMLSAYMPEAAKGFTVETLSANIIDLGTEFSIKTSELESEVYVYKGEVVVAPTQENQEEPLHLFTNQASRINVNSPSPVGIDMKHDMFLRNLNEPSQKYPKAIKNLKPFAYYRMRPTEDLTLFDNSRSKKHGQFISSNTDRSLWKSGRHGASFHCLGPGMERYAIVNDFKMKAEPFTIVAWVLAKSRPRKGTIINHGGVENKGVFNLGLFRRTGELVGQINSGVDNRVIIKSPNLIPLNEWLHIAFSANGEELSLYINGKRIASEAYSKHSYDPGFNTLSIGAKFIDNPKRFKSRSEWDGRIDELAMFDYALNPSDIEKLYQLSRGAAE